MEYVITFILALTVAATAAVLRTRALMQQAERTLLPRVRPPKARLRHHIPAMSRPVVRQGYVGLEYDRHVLFMPSDTPNQTDPKPKCFEWPNGVSGLVWNKSKTD